MVTPLFSTSRFFPRSTSHSTVIVCMIRFCPCPQARIVLKRTPRNLGSCLLIAMLAAIPMTPLSVQVGEQTGLRERAQKEWRETEAGGFLS